MMYLKAILYMVSITICLLLFGSFIEMNWNFTEWAPAGRALCSVLWLICCCFIYVALLSKE